MTLARSRGCYLWTCMILAGALALPASADPKLAGRTYHFGTHPARTNITFVSEADLETIHGITHEIDGALEVDEAGSSVSGTLRVPVSSMKTGIDLRNEHLRSDQWLDAKHYPWIQLDVVKATESKDKKPWAYEAKLTIKGKTRELKGTARVSPIPDRFAPALGPGSWVRVRTEFSVTLSDFGIQIPEQIGPKVSKTWAISVDIYGTTVLPKHSK